MGLKNRIGLYKYSLFIFLGLLILSDYYHNITGPRRAIKSHFKGVVDSVYYDGKKFPHVYINGKERDIFYMTWHDSFIIHKGDTLVKKKGDLRLKLIQPNKKDTIFFNDSD